MVVVRSRSIGTTGIFLSTSLCVTGSAGRETQCRVKAADTEADTRTRAGAHAGTGGSQSGEHAPLDSSQHTRSHPHTFRAVQEGSVGVKVLRRKGAAADEASREASAGLLEAEEHLVVRSAVASALRKASAGSSARAYRYRRLRRSSKSAHATLHKLNEPTTETHKKYANESRRSEPRRLTS